MKKINLKLQELDDPEVLSQEEMRHLSGGSSFVACGYECMALGVSGFCYGPIWNCECHTGAGPYSPSFPC